MKDCSKTSQYSSTPWNLYGESQNKACLLLNAVLRFPFLINQVTAMKCYRSYKPLIRQPKRDIDVYEAYCQVDDLKDQLKPSREQVDTQF